MATIFVRQRRDVGRRAGRPRFTVVGIEGSDLKFFRPNLRRVELETIAETIDAQIVMLQRGSGEHDGEEGASRRVTEAIESFD